MTLDTLRKFLRDAGCVEERALSVPGYGSLFLQYTCHMKRGSSCQATFAVDPQGGRLPAELVAAIGSQLSRCLGHGWTKRVPEQDPFG